MKRRKFGKNLIFILILSFIIATVIFVDVFFIAHAVSYFNYQGIKTKNNILVEYINLADERLNNFVCDNKLMEESSLSLDEISIKLSLLEKRFGKDDLRVLEQKKLYSELENLHYELIKEFEKNCGLDFISVLFFYNNEREFEDESERMGFILTSFKQKALSNVMIYSFDCNLDSPIIDNLKEKYNITKCPIVVINEGEAFYLRNIIELDKYLD
jgi:hypothetical protein